MLAVCAVMLRCTPAVAAAAAAGTKATTGGNSIVLALKRALKFALHLVGHASFGLLLMAKLRAPQRVHDAWFRAHLCECKRQ